MPRAAQRPRLSATHPGGGAINGTLSKNRQDSQEAQVQGARAQSLPRLRPRARLYSQVSDVQNLLPRHGAQGRNSRRRESKLVGANRKIMQTDPIGDFLTRIRNASAAKHQRVDVPVSKLKTEIARILKDEGYISTFKLVDENKTRKVLRVFLKYTPDRRSVITGVKRISRPGARLCRLRGYSPGRRRLGHQHCHH